MKRRVRPDRRDDHPPRSPARPGVDRQQVGDDGVSSSGRDQVLGGSVPELRDWGVPIPVNRPVAISGHAHRGRQNPQRVSHERLQLGIGRRPGYRRSMHVGQLRQVLQMQMHRGRKALRRDQGLPRAPQIVGKGLEPGIRFHVGKSARRRCVDHASIIRRFRSSSMSLSCRFRDATRLVVPSRWHRQSRSSPPARRPWHGVRMRTSSGSYSSVCVTVVSFRGQAAWHMGPGAGNESTSGVGATDC